MREVDAGAALAHAHAVITKQHEALEATLEVQDALMRSVTGADEAFRALKGALERALQLLDQGKPARAREVVATLAAIELPARPALSTVVMPALPTLEGIADV